MGKSKWDSKNCPVTHRKTGKRKQTKTQKTKREMAGTSPNLPILTVSISVLNAPVVKTDAGRVDKRYNPTIR